MLKQRMPLESSPSAIENETRSTRIGNLGRRALKGVVSLGQRTRERSSDLYYRGAYQTGRLAEELKGLVGKMAKAPYYKGVDYGRRYYENEDAYRDRMERKGARANLVAAGLAVTAIAAYTFAARFGVLDGAPDLQLSADTDADLRVTPQPDAPPSETSTPRAEVPTMQKVEKPSSPAESPQLLMGDGESPRVTPRTEAVIDELLDGYTVQGGDSVWSVMEDALVESGDTSIEDPEINALKNDFIERHGDQVTDEGFLLVGQTLDTK